MNLSEIMKESMEAIAGYYEYHCTLHIAHCTLMEGG